MEQSIGIQNGFQLLFQVVNTMTTVPFAKNIHFDFGVFYIPAVIFILTATSNAVNLTDGLDGLAIGTVGIAAFALAVICYVSGNAVFAQYLNIVHLRGADELTIYCAALVGASLGFLWFNSHPAQIFMGDTVFSFRRSLRRFMCFNKERISLANFRWNLFAETLSVIVQVGYFKYTKRKQEKE